MLVSLSNPSVWLLWDYLVFRGLLNYGYRADTEEIAQRNIDAVTFSYQYSSGSRF